MHSTIENTVEKIPVTETIHLSVSHVRRKYGWLHELWCLSKNDRSLHNDNIKRHLTQVSVKHSTEVR